MRFHKHYSLQEARELLPQVRKWLDKLMKFRRELQKHDEVMDEKMSGGADLGGPEVNAWVRCMAEIKGVLLEFFEREIQVKDLDRGLIDFPAYMEGQEVFLCWQKGEKDIEFWHDLEAGFAGRKRITDD